MGVNFPVNFPWKSLLLCLAAPLGVGALSGLVNGPGMAAFDALTKPPLTPPDWVFAAVWTVLLGISYALCGYGLLFFQNLVWLDAMALFPLLMLALGYVLLPF